MRLIRNLPRLAVMICVAWVHLAGAAAVRDITGFNAVPDDKADASEAIQRAMDASNAGDTVFIPAGTFLIRHSIKARSDIKIQGAGQDRTTLRMDAGRPTDFFDLSGLKNVELLGFCLDGKGSPNARHGIFARSGGGHVIHGLTIQNLGSPGGSLGIHFTGEDVKAATGVCDCIIASNIIRNVSVGSEWGGGIRLSWGSSRNQILGNVVDNTGRGGIFANDGSTDLVIRSNTVTRSGRKAEKLGIEVWRECDRVVIEDNRLDHWLSIGGASQVAARRNIITAPAADVAFIGLELIGQNLVVTDNEVEGAQQIGVSISNNASNQWQYCAYNTIRRMVQWGAQVQGDKTGARMLYFYRNKFLETQRGNVAAIYPGADGRGFRLNGNCQQVTLDSNEISHNSAEGIELGGRGIDHISLVGNSVIGNGFAAVSGDPSISLEWTDNIVSGNGKDSQLRSRRFEAVQPMLVDFVFPVSAVVGEQVTFTNLSVARIEHVLWDFGEGIPSCQPEGVHVYSRHGSYRVTLIVWDNQGRGAIKERTVSVAAANRGAR